MENTNHVAVLLEKALALHRGGQLTDAAKLYQQTLELDARNGDALNLLGLVQQAQGDQISALFSFEKAILANPKMATAHYNKAMLLDQLGRHDDAIQNYKQSISLNSHYADAYLNLGSVFYKTGNVLAAIETFQLMTNYCPSDARGHYNLGRCLAEKRDFIAAESSLQNAISIHPDYTDALVALAKVYADQHETAQAITTIQKATARRPENALALTNLGTYLAHADEHEQSERALDLALKANPNYVSAKVNKGLTQLAMGKLGDGWDNYADRAETTGSHTFRKLNLPWPSWKGEPLNGKSILIWGEQGLGDEILFAGLLPELATRVSHCTLGCQPRLVRIFQRSFPSLKIASLDSILGDLGALNFDFHTSLIDLGRWARRSFAAFPNRDRYLIADAGKSLALRQRLIREAKQGQTLVGFSWKSYAPHIGALKTPPLEIWRPLLTCPQYKIVSLQYGPAEEVARDVTWFNSAYGTEIYCDDSTEGAGDLDALATLTNAVDSVVTVSNTTAHLGGALGLPTLVAVPEKKARLWYWFKSGDHSPWYPQIRLWRWAETGTSGLAHSISDGQV